MGDFEVLTTDQAHMLRQFQVGSTLSSFFSIP